MYSDLSDNELLELIGTKKNNEAMETLIKRYGPFVTRQSRSLYIIGADEGLELLHCRVSYEAHRWYCKKYGYYCKGRLPW